MTSRQLIETYHNAWTTGDFAAARNCLADDLDFRGSMQSFSRADDFMGGLRQFQQMLLSAPVLSSFFGEDGGALLYDCETGPIGVVRTAEFFSVRNGTIAEIRLVFDASTLRPLMQP